MTLGLVFGFVGLEPGHRSKCGMTSWGDQYWKAKAHIQKCKHGLGGKSTPTVRLTVLSYD